MSIKIANFLNNLLFILGFQGIFGLARDLLRFLGQGGFILSHDGYYWAFARKGAGIGV